MLRYDFLQLRLNRGVNCDWALLDLSKISFSHYFDISLLAGGGLTAFLQKVRIFLCYDSDGNWMDVGC
jgi:hypothetical protein